MKITVQHEYGYYYATARHHTKRGDTREQAIQLLIAEMRQSGTISLTETIEVKG